MPAQPGELNDLTAATRLSYEKAWQQVQDEIEALALDPKQARKRARLQQTERAISAIMDELDGDAESFVAKAMPEAFGLGGTAGAGEASGGAAEFVWNQVSQQAVQTISNNLLQDLLTATKGVKQSTKKLIREVAKDEELRALIQGDTAVNAGKRLRQIIEANGVHAVKYADGSQHGLREYAQMAIRTQTGTAYNMGSLEGAAQQGTRFWECFDGPGCGWSYHDDPNQALGRIVSRDEAAAFPLSHPNCRRAFGPRPDVISKAQAEKINKNGGAGSVTDGQVKAQQAQDEERIALQRRRAARQRALTKKTQQEQSQSPIQASRAERIRARKQRVGREAKPQAQPALALDGDLIPTDPSGVVNGIDYYKDVKSVQQLIDEGYKPEDAIKENKRQKANAASRASKARKKLLEGKPGEKGGKSWVDQLKESSPAKNSGKNATILHSDLKYGDKQGFITGAAHKAFTMDTAPGEYVPIDHMKVSGHQAAGKPPIIESGIAVRRDGVVYWLETTPGEPITDVMKAELEKNISDVQKALMSAPAEHRAMQLEVGFAKQANPDDAYWSAKYGKDFKSAATGGNGRTIFWNTRVRPSTVLHELGHTVDSNSGIGGAQWLSDVAHVPSTPTGKTWLTAMADDVTVNSSIGDVGSKAAYSHPIVTGQQGVTKYGLTNRREDFAEAYRLYLQDRFDGFIGTAPDGTPLRFVDLFPERAKILDKLTGYVSPSETTWRTNQRAKLIDLVKTKLDPEGHFSGNLDDLAKQIALPSDEIAKVVTSVEQSFVKPAVKPSEVFGTPKSKADLPKNVQASIASKKSKYKKQLIEQGVDPQTAAQKAAELEAQEVAKRLQELGGVVGEKTPIPGGTGGREWRPGLDAKANSRANGFLGKRQDPEAGAAGPKLELTDLKVAHTQTIDSTLPGAGNYHIAYYEKIFAGNVTAVETPGGKVIGYVGKTKDGKWMSYKTHSNNGGVHSVQFASNKYVSQNSAIQKLLDVENAGGKVSVTSGAGAAKDDLVKAIAARLNNKDDWEIFRDYQLRLGNRDPGMFEALDSAARHRALYADVNERIRTWASTSGDSSKTAVAMQMAIKEEFKTGGEAMVRVGTQGYGDLQSDIVKFYNETAGAWYRRFARAQYENTQERLAAAGIEEVSLYRGMAFNGTGWWSTGGTRGTRSTVRARLQPANSWSTARAQSMKFTHGGNSRRMFEATIPRERILGCARTGFGCLNEKEYVILETDGESLMEIL